MRRNMSAQGDSPALSGAIPSVRRRALKVFVLKVCALALDFNKEIYIFLYIFK